MSAASQQLEHELLSAFDRALRENCPDVAEVMLQAIELLGRDDPAYRHELPPNVVEAYALVVNRSKR